MKKIYNKMHPKFSLHIKDNYEFEIDKPWLHMFWEDISLGVMPITGESKNYPEFKACIIGDESLFDNVKKILASLSEFRNERNSTKLVCDSINNITRYLCYEGFIRYEILNLIPGNKDYQLFYFPNKYVYKFFDYYIQHIPKNKSFDNIHRIAYLNEKEVFELKIPIELGGIKAFQKIKKILNKYDIIGPEFFTNEPNLLLNTHSFDFSKYIYHLEILSHRITANYGWYKRDTSDKLKTEFYLFYLILKNKWVQAILREYVILKLNDLFAKLKIDARIEITGIPTSDDLLKMREEFVEGKIKLESLSEKLWF